MKEAIKDIQQILADKGFAHAPVVGFLDYVREVRNAADHPDRVFGQAEAEQVFVGVTTAIRELERLKGGLA